ncbi:hypothetical protein WKI68_22325 [Streptomyces sp. MS1.HAVA.3]|uniref:Uncharacterized protein n=1 Tax=Streptomyces caledonius TaxID=3134107 RepID=A0ABU8U675_9ACTN
MQSLGAVSRLLKPVTDLLAAVLKSPDGKIPEADLAAPGRPDGARPLCPARPCGPP